MNKYALRTIKKFYPEVKNTLKNFQRIFLFKQVSFFPVLLSINTEKGRSIMTEKVYGYVRVSSVDQKEDRQMMILSEKGVPEKNIYLDKQSGKDFNRPQYQKMIKKFISIQMLKYQ